MHIILSDQSGRRTQGLLLAVSANRLRIVVPRRGDTIELRLTEGRWISEQDDPVEIESLVSDGRTAITGFVSHFVPLTHTARN